MKENTTNGTVGTVTDRRVDDVVCHIIVLWVMANSAPCPNLPMLAKSIDMLVGRLKPYLNDRCAVDESNRLECFERPDMTVYDINLEGGGDMDGVSKANEAVGQSDIKKQLVIELGTAFDNLHNGLAAIPRGKTFTVDHGPLAEKIIEMVGGANQAQDGPATDGLSFNDLRKANLERLPQFRNAMGDRVFYAEGIDHWSLAEWMNALSGEVGEAANIVKKIHRGDFSLDDVLGLLADELGDIQTYLDLVAIKARVDLGGVTINKFNRVSQRADSTVFLGSEKEGDSNAE